MEAGRLFGPWTRIQENGSSLLCGVTLSVTFTRETSTNRARELSFFIITECLTRVLILDATTKVRSNKFLVKHFVIKTRDKK